METCSSCGNCSTRLTYGYNDSDPDVADTSKRRRIWPLLLRAGGKSSHYSLNFMKDKPGHDYILKVVSAGGFELLAKAH